MFEYVWNIKKNMKNIQNILEKLSSLQELIIERSMEICQSEDVTAKDLAFSSRVVKESYDTIIKYCSKSGLIEREINIAKIAKDGKKPLVKDVYDIMALEDILQQAREDFKDDLHLIEHHQNSMETIKRAKAYVNRVLEESENEEEDFEEEFEGKKFNYEANDEIYEDEAYASLNFNDKGETHHNKRNFST